MLVLTLFFALQASEPGVAAEVPPQTVVRRKRPPRAGEFSIHIDNDGAPAAGASAADLLKLAPGVHLSQHAGQGKAPQIFLRGFDAEHGQDVEVIVGGLPVNEPSNVHGQGYADPTFVPTEVVRTLRVKLGTYDPRQGDFAVAGSVYYDLGLADEGTTLRLSAGAFGLLRTFVGFRPRGADEDTFVAAELVRSDGFGSSRSFERGSALAQGAYNLNDAIRIRVLGGTSTARFSSAGVLRLDDINDGTVDRLDSYEPGQGGTSARHHVLVEGTYKAAESKSMVTFFATNRALSLRHNFTGSFLFADGDTTAQTSTATTVGISAEHDQKLTFLDAAQHLVVGIQARSDAVASTQDRVRSDGIVHTREVDAQLSLGHIAVFGEAVVRFLPNTTMRAGVRAEAVSFGVEDALRNDGSGSTRDAFGFFVAPRLSADWHVLPWFNVTAGYGEGFRTPQALALARAEVAAVTRVRTGELGVRAAMVDPSSDGSESTLEPITAAVSGFISHLEQDRVFDHATATSLFIGPTLRAGVTGFITSQPTRFLATTASVTWVKAVLLNDGSDVPFAPPVVARLDSRWHDDLFEFTPSWGPFGEFWGTTFEGFVEAGASAVGSRPLPFGDIAPPLALLSGAIGMRAWSTTLSVEGLNILDAKVNDGEFSYSSRFSAGDGGLPARHVTAAPPRLWQATLSVTF